MGERTWVLSRVQLRRLHRSLRGLHLSLRGLVSGAALLPGLGGDSLLLDQHLGTLRLASAAAGFAARPGQLRLGPGQFRAVASGIDHEEHIALLDLVSFAIGDPLDVARHPWAQLDALDGFDASVVFVPLRDGLDLDLRDADLRRRWMASGASSGVLFTTCERHRAEGDQYPKQAHAARVGAGSRHLNRFRGQVVKRMKRARSRCTLSPDAAFLAAQDHERQMRQRSNPVGCRLLVSSQNARANRPRRHYKASKLEVKRYRRSDSRRCGLVRRVAFLDGS
ncbi:hypothetical protein PZT60_06790 [Pseudomonas aeruginosa]|nr:hypothetical protein [Pseudomonas aeruginosa]MEA8502129.1 hypothetical protein [Pseudomonas aeruginosa]